MSWIKITKWLKNLEKTVTILVNIGGLLLKPLRENYNIVSLLAFILIAIYYKDNSVFLIEVIKPLLKWLPKIKDT